MRRRILCSLVVFVAIGVAALAARVEGAQSAGPPTATGTGGAAATVDMLATQAAVDTLRRGGNAVDAAVAAAARPRRDRAVLLRRRRGRVHGHSLPARSDGKVTTIDGREAAPAAMRPDSFWENGAPLPFNDARYSGLSVGVPGTVETWDEALERYGTISLAEALAAAIRVARDGFVVDQTFFDQTQDNVDFFNDIPATAALYLDPGRHAARRRHRLPQSRPREHVRAHRAPRREGLLPRCGRRRARRDGPAPGRVADRQSHLAAGLMTMRDLHTYAAPERDADARRLPRPRRLRDGPALERRLDRRRGAQHPRGLPALDDDAGGGAALLHRGLALLVRRPRRLSRRSGVLRRAADGPALGRVRGHAARADHGDGRDEPGRARRSVSVQRRRRRERPGLGERDSRRGRPRTSRPPTAGATSSRTRSRSSPPAAPASSSRVSASSRTTS